MQISEQGDAKEVSEVNQLKNAKSLVQETKEDEAQRWEDLQTVVYSHRNKFCQHVHLHWRFHRDCVVIKITDWMSSATFVMIRNTNFYAGVS